MSSAVYRFHNFVLDCGARELRKDGEPVSLPARTLECLETLIAHRDRAVGRDELALAIFSRDNVSDAQLGQIVLRARRAVGDDGQEQRCIRTVPRFGFRWVADTEEAGSAEAVPATTTPAAAPAAAAGAATPLDEDEDGADRGGGQGLLLAAVAIAVLTTAGAWWALAHRPQAVQGPLPARVERVDAAVIVLPTEVSGPGEAAWARLGLMDFVGDRLRRGGLAVPPSESVLSLLHGAASADARRARARAAAGNGWTIASVATLRGDRWRVELSADGADRGIRHGEGEHAELLKAADLAVGRLLAAFGSRAVDDGGVALELAERLQRAQAAMLSNELDTARRILQQAPELQREQPQLRLRLVQVDFRAGKYREGLAEVDRLLRDAAAEDPLFRARARMVRGAINIRLDRYRDGERDYTEAIALLDPEKDAAALGGALTGRGITRSALGRFDAALEDLGRARILLTRTGDTLAVARVDSNLGHLEEQRGRPAQAVEFLSRAAAQFERFGAVHELVSVHSTLATIQLQLLRPDRARAGIDRAWALRARITDVNQVTNVALGRAEVLMRQGEFEAVRALLSEHGDGPVLPGDLHRADAIAVELARRQGQPALAAARADAALARWEPEAWTSRLRQIQAMRQQAALEADRPLREDIPTGGEDAVSRLIAAAAARDRGLDAAADEAYRAAVARAEAGGIPRQVADAVLAYAPWLIERGELTEAAALVGRIAPWAGQDFDLAVLQLRLFHALGQEASWEAALQDARRLAGERPIPDALLAPPAER